MGSVGKNSLGVEGFFFGVKTNEKLVIHEFKNGLGDFLAGQVKKAHGLAKGSGASEPVGKEGIGQRGGVRNKLGKTT